jgi:hypothetical protein
MKSAKSLVLALSLVLAVLLPACRTAPPPAAASVAAVPPELLEQRYLFEVVRYLYRWELDETEVQQIVGARHFVFWVHRLEPKRDPGDRSLEAEILLPQLGMTVRVKKSDYTIAELGTVVKSRTFKIMDVTREPIPVQAPPACAVVDVNVQEMRDYLFRTRDQHDYPNPALLDRLRQAVLEEESKDGFQPTNSPAAEQIFHVAPMSPVANEIWVFWESGRKLFYFSSDIDLSNPAVWQHEALMVRVFDLDEQVVVSHEEVPGSNRFLTRNEVGRALFNCIVLGQRLTVSPVTGSESIGPK